MLLLPTKLQGLPPACPIPPVYPRAFAHTILSAWHLLLFFLDWLTPASFRFWITCCSYGKPFLARLQRRTAATTHICRVYLLSSYTRVCQFFSLVGTSPPLDTMFKEHRTQSVFAAASQSLCHGARSRQQAFSSTDICWRKG